MSRGSHILGRGWNRLYDGIQCCKLECSIFTAPMFQNEVELCRDDNMEETEGGEHVSSSLVQ